MLLIRAATAMYSRPNEVNVTKEGELVIVTVMTSLMWWLHYSIHVHWWLIMDRFHWWLYWSVKSSDIFYPNKILGCLVFIFWKFWKCWYYVILYVYGIQGRIWEEGLEPPLLGPDLKYIFLADCAKVYIKQGLMAYIIWISLEELL